MKDYRSPACKRHCGADLLILDARDDIQKVEDEAEQAGCLTANGAFNCEGPLLTISKDGTEAHLNSRIECQAGWETPIILHGEDLAIANAFDAQIQRIISEAFEVA